MKKPKLQTITFLFKQIAYVLKQKSYSLLLGLFHLTTKNNRQVFVKKTVIY